MGKNQKKAGLTESRRLLGTQDGKGELRERQGQCKISDDLMRTKCAIISRKRTLGRSAKGTSTSPLRRQKGQHLGVFTGTPKSPRAQTQAGRRNNRWGLGETDELQGPRLSKEKKAIRFDLPRRGEPGAATTNGDHKKKLRGMVISDRRAIRQHGLRRKEAAEPEKVL